MVPAAATCFRMTAMSALPAITALTQCALPNRNSENGPRQRLEVKDPMQATSVAYRFAGLQDLLEIAHAAPITGVYFLCFAVCRAKTRPRKRCASSAGSSDRRASLPARLMQSKRRR